MVDERCDDSKIKFIRGQLRMLFIWEQLPKEIGSLLKQFEKADTLEKEKQNARTVVQSS